MDFRLREGSAPPTPALFKGQLYSYKITDLNDRLYEGGTYAGPWDWGRLGGREEKGKHFQTGHNVRAKWWRQERVGWRQSCHAGAFSGGSCACFWPENIPVTWLLPPLEPRPLLCVPLRSHQHQHHQHHYTYSGPATTLSALHVLFNWILSTVLWDIYCYLILQMKEMMLDKVR